MSTRSGCVLGRVAPVTAILFALSLTASLARGSVTYSFAFDQPAYTVERTHAVDIPVYLVETVTGTNQSLLATENGLFSAAVTLVRTGASGNTPGFFAGAGAVEPNTTAFSDASDQIFGPLITVTAARDQAQLLEFARTSGVTGTVVAPGVRRVLLGTFSVTTGSRANQTSTFTARVYDPAGSNVVTWTNYLVLEAPPYGITPASVTITSIRGPCGTADFNGDGDLGTDADIAAFFACLGGACCTDCDSADFNGDGDIGTDRDIEAFFRVLGGGPC